MLTELSAVAFKDVNKDGLKDIIIIAYYMTGVGENGAEEFPVAGIYFQREMEFIDISEIDDQINAGGKNENIEEVIKFTKSIDFSKLSPSKTSSKQIDTSIGAAKNLETATIKQPELTITPTSTPTVTPTNYPDC